MTLEHNAYLIEGSAATLLALSSLLKREGYETEGNADVFLRTYTHFGVDDARDLRERAALSALGERRIFIITTPVITTQAQNALLKTLEDAVGNALFFFIVPNPHALLSTVRSRTQILTLEADTGEGTVESAPFLAASPDKRIDMLKVLLDKGEDDTRDIAGINALLSSLERALGSARGLQKHQGLEAVYRAKKYLGDNGALLKPLLEQVALLVPVIK